MLFIILCLLFSQQVNGLGFPPEKISTLSMCRDDAACEVYGCNFDALSKRIGYKCNGYPYSLGESRIHVNTDREISTCYSDEKSILPHACSKWLTQAKNKSLTACEMVTDSNKQCSPAHVAECSGHPCGTPIILGGVSYHMACCKNGLLGSSSTVSNSSVYLEVSTYITHSTCTHDGKDIVCQGNEFQTTYSGSQGVWYTNYNTYYAFSLGRCYAESTKGWICTYDSQNKHFPNYNYCFLLVFTAAFILFSYQVATSQVEYKVLYTVGGFAFLALFISPSIKSSGIFMATFIFSLIAFQLVFGSYILFFRKGEEATEDKCSFPQKYMGFGILDPDIPPMYQ